MVIIYLYQHTVLQAIGSLIKSSFGCLFVNFGGLFALPFTYSGADDSLSVKVFVDLFCSPQAAHRADKTKPRTFSF